MKGHFYAKTKLNSLQTQTRDKLITMPRPSHLWLQHEVWCRNPQAPARTTPHTTPSPGPGAGACNNSNPRGSTLYPFFHEQLWGCVSLNLLGCKLSSPSLKYYTINPSHRPYDQAFIVDECKKNPPDPVFLFFHEKQQAN